MTLDWRFFTRCPDEGPTEMEKFKDDLDVMKMIADRDEARRIRDFNLADDIRISLVRAGVDVLKLDRERRGGLKNT